MEKSQIAKGIMAGLIIVHGHSFAAETEGESVFSPLTITDNPLAEKNQVGSSEESYARPGAYSSRTLNKNLQGLDASLREVWRGPIRKSIRCRVRSASIFAA